MQPDLIKQILKSDSVGLIQDLAELFIVSKCLIGGDIPVGAVEGKGVRNGGLSISAFEAPGTKCPRCWIHTEQADPETGLCPRCSSVIRNME